MWPWISLHEWKPFNIDALGLVTLLGAEEVDASIGRLVRSRYLEYMPLLAGYVFAGDRFRKKNPSFHLYNITRGIYTTDISFWFTRWVEAQSFETVRNVVYWTAETSPRPWLKYHAISFALSFCFTGFAVVLATLSKDWYGMANALALVTSIVVRTYLLQANRDALDREIECSSSTTGHDKVVVVTRDAKIITMFIPGKLIVPIFVNNPVATLDWLYHLVRWIGWVAFAIHIVALGMTKLASQMYVVALLVIPTVLSCWGFGCDDSQLQLNWKKSVYGQPSEAYSCYIGSRLRAEVSVWPPDLEFLSLNPGWDLKTVNNIDSLNGGSTRRQDLYAWLNLSAEEEESLGKWDLLPHTRNNDNQWTEDYNAKKSLIRRKLDSVARTGTLQHQSSPSSGDTVSGQRRIEEGRQNFTALPFLAKLLYTRGPQRQGTNLSASGTV